MGSGLSEFKMIEKFKQEFSRLRRPGNIGIGDDAAVVDGKMLLTTDVMIAGVHFIPGKIGFENLGYKSMAVNISDIAAMGGKPLYALLSLGLDKALQEQDIEKLILGIRQAADEYGFDLIGGNTAASPALFVGVTMIGEALGKPLLRSGAQTGDFIYVSGKIGDSSIGLSILQDRLNGRVGDPDYFIRRHHRPQARTDLIRHLLAHYPVTSCIDISDGFLADLEHIAFESGKGFDIDAGKLPISMEEIGAGFPAGRNYFMDFALSGGEDYELIFTSPAEMAANSLFSETGVQISSVGRITGNEKRVRLDGKDLDYLKLHKGFVHLEA